MNNAEYVSLYVLKIVVGGASLYANGIWFGLVWFGLVWFDLGWVG